MCDCSDAVLLRPDDDDPNLFSADYGFVHTRKGYAENHPCQYTDFPDRLLLRGMPAVQDQDHERGGTEHYPRYPERYLCPFAGAALFLL